MAEVVSSHDISAPLLAQTSAVRGQFDTWIGDTRASADLIERQHRSSLAAAQAEISASAAREGEISHRANAFRVAREEHAGELTKQEEGLRGLEGQLTGLPAKVEALRAEKAEAASRIAAVEAERERVDAEASRKMKELTRGVLMYKCLGLEFERANEDWLCIRYTQIDPTNHNREFMFWISVGNDDSYQVQGCTPEIDAERLAGLVVDVNETNDFGSFVRQMRKAFKELV